MIDTVSLLDISHSRRQLVFRFAADRMRFSTSYWYDSVDFDHLRKTFAGEKLDRILFHIAAFEINKVCSLQPRTLDWGRFAAFADHEFTQLWRSVFTRVWAQWRYENDSPDYYGPEFPITGHSSGLPITLAGTSQADPAILALFGGGKDSLVSAKLLECLPGGYDTLAYSSSIYGTADRQHDLIGGLLRFCTPSNQRRQFVFDDFVDSPVLRLGDRVTAATIAAAETPSSVFAALPYILQHKYTHLTLAHERSADLGQLHWRRTGEEINHQWGKSYEAEKLLNDYISERLIEGLSYFSILKPIHDVVIFNMLRRHPEAVPHTHSCNVAKPWCRRCAKCLYVWVNYLAYLPREIVNPMFGENPFEVSENLDLFRQMLGLTHHMPFECIGHMDEIKLAFEVCRRNGLRGKAMDLFVHNVPKIDYATLIDRYTQVDFDQSGLPEFIKNDVAGELDAGAAEARRYLWGFA